MVFLLIKRCKGSANRAKNQRKTSFICFCSHLFVPLASPKVGCVSENQRKNILFFGISLGLHYLCPRFEEDMFVHRVRDALFDFMQEGKAGYPTRHPMG